MIKKAAFRETVVFALGIFTWSAFVQSIMLCGGVPRFSMGSLVASIAGVIAALYALRYGHQWYGKKEVDES